jgi:AraC family transcriptional regulator of adaptative response/methylated-DNA-[protein]-cysteine methyltransferase
VRTIVSATLDTPLGRAVVAASDDGVCLLELGPDDRVDRQLDALETWLGAQTQMGENHHLELLEAELNAYFNGTLKAFTVCTDTPGTPFQQRVWKALQRIPFGTTASYRDIADDLNAPSATRAVGGANGANRLSIVIPCHRVIGIDGSMTGFGGGIEIKRMLLEHERKVSGVSLWSVSPASDG